MTDAQPADQLVAALVEIAHNTSMSVPVGSWPVHHHADNVRRCIAIAAAAIPIARAMAERERERVALKDAAWSTLGLLNEMHFPTQGCRDGRCTMRTDFCAARAYLEETLSARAAGVEVIGHDG